MTLHQNTRMRHETGRRNLTVTAVEKLSPQMVRFTLHSDDLHDFFSGSADDHIKLVFATGDEPEGQRPPMRDYTPRSFDPASGEIVIDFALHGSGHGAGGDVGPATMWATSAEVGDTLSIAGPRGSLVVPDDYDYYLLVGDETALPSIGRRISETRADAKIYVIAAVENEAEQIALPAHPGLSINWLHHQGNQDDVASLMASAVQNAALPEGDGYIWVAAEASSAKAVRGVITEQGHPAQWTKVAGYWTRNLADSHAKFE